MKKVTTVDGSTVLVCEACGEEEWACDCTAPPVEEALQPIDVDEDCLRDLKAEMEINKLSDDTSLSRLQRAHHVRDTWQRRYHHMRNRALRAEAKCARLQKHISQFVDGRGRKAPPTSTAP